MRLRLVDSGDLALALAASLDGGIPIAPIPDARQLGALRVDEPVTEADAAAVVTSSGSTGEPKAVVLTRTALRFAVGATHERLGGPGDWVCALPTQHVAGLMTVARAVIAGTRHPFRARRPRRPAGAGRADATSRWSLRSSTGRWVTQGTAAKLRDYAAVLLGGGADSRGPARARHGCGGADRRHLRDERDLRRLRVRRCAAGRGPRGAGRRAGSASAGRWPSPATGCAPT